MSKEGAFYFTPPVQLRAVLRVTLWLLSQDFLTTALHRVEHGVARRVANYYLIRLYSLQFVLVV